ncbi:hypothetical protein [Halobacterium sp. CBA1126]|uniref:hypothetical protein n=1 Tax=Halobacterium sp. CBA1126 TaxID=2668074 RepID=UPI0012F7E112|nr:hypothetical protein [Halobacterium sp. CBA1126]MUV59509.1 hypothetical protein [Halobacterium sp. CBA1126]
MLPFDDETLARVAADTDVEQAALREAAAAVQSTLSTFPGRTVDGLVYEWRQAVRADPLVERRPDAWVLRVPDHVWVDVRDRAGVSEDVVDALLALYATETGTETASDDDGVPLVVGRRADE